VNHSPIWSHHGIRILAGPSALWLDARGQRFPAPLFPGFDALGALRHVIDTGYDYSWFVLDQATLSTEIALSGSEQNGDLTGKNLRLLAGRVRAGPTPEVRAFQERGIDFLSAGSVLELAAQMNQLVGEHLVDGESLQQLIEARDLQVRSGLGKDPQVVATAAARRFAGDRLMRVVTPHELLDPKDPGAGRAGSGGPLIAIRLHVLTRKTLGGLETDLDGRALRPDGSALPGVYAVGEAAGVRWRRRPRLPSTRRDISGWLPVHWAYGRAGAGRGSLTLRPESVEGAPSLSSKGSALVERLRPCRRVQTARGATTPQVLLAVLWLSAAL